jgi:hypothetical protein
MSNDGTMNPMNDIYIRMQKGEFDINKTTSNQPQNSMGPPMNQIPQQNAWGNQPGGQPMNTPMNGPMNIPMNNPNMPINSQPMFMANQPINPNIFWANNNVNNPPNPGMMMPGQPIYYGYPSGGFMPQPGPMPSNFGTMFPGAGAQWQFPQNQVNPVPQQQQNDGNGQHWTLKFEKKEDGQFLNVQITDDLTVDEAISRYRKKTMDISPLQFKYNGKPLNPVLKLNQSGLKNNATIIVEKADPNSFNQGNFQQPQQPPFPPQFQPQFGQINPQVIPMIQPQDGSYNLVFEQKAGGQSITIQISPDKRVSDAINSFKNKIFYQGQMKFIFNGQNLDENLTIQAAGLRNGSKILVIGTKDIEGAF